MKRFVVIGIIFISLLLLFGIFQGPLSVLGDGEYHTGFTNDDVNNCETVHKKAGCTTVGNDLGCWYGDIKKDYTEIIRSPSNNAPIITSMERDTGDRSIEITLGGNLAYIGLPMQYWYPEWGWFKVDIAYNKHLNGKPEWQTILNTKDGQIDPELCVFLAGSNTKQKYNKWQGSQVIPGFGDVFSIMVLDTVTFALKNSQVGILRVQHITEFSALQGLQHETNVMSEDYAYLVSGKGEIYVLENEDYRYIAGVDTLRLSINTGYSGYTVGGEYQERGWELKIYDNYDNIRKRWEIGDDKHTTRYDRNGQLLDFPIPADAVSSDADHEWSIILTNKIIEEDVKQVFVITQEELLKAPDMEPITFGDTQYSLGDTIVINFEGIPNPTGRNAIDGFYVALRYGDFHSMDFVGDYNYKYIPATGNKGTISFTASKCDTYLSVEAWAFDYPKSQGGIMSGRKTAQIWIKDEDAPPIKLDWMPLVFAIMTFVVFLVIGLLVPIPWHFRVVIIAIGAIIAYLIYIYLP